MFTVPKTAWVGSPLGLVSGAMAWYARKTYPLTSTTYRTSRAPGSKSRLTIVHAQTDANSCPCARRVFRRQSAVWLEAVWLEAVWLQAMLGGNVMLPGRIILLGRPHLPAASAGSAKRDGL